MGLETKIENWLRREVLTEKPQGCVVRFELRHLPLGSKKGQEVMVFEPVGDPPEDTWFTELSAEVYANADGDATGIGGVQTYVLQSFRKKDPSKATARHTFRINGDEDSDESGFSSEPATGKGLLAQLMRHTEVLQRTLTATTASAMSSSQRQIAQLQEQNERLMVDRFETVKLYEELLSHKQERELAVQESERNGRLMEDGVKTLKLLAPIAVNKLAGKEVIPQEKDAKDLALLEFFQSLTKEQQVEIYKTLTEAQRATLGELMTTMMN